MIGRTPRYDGKLLDTHELHKRTVGRPALVPLPGSDSRYVLVEPYRFSLAAPGQEEGAPTWTVHRGYVYDGATIWSRIGLTWALSTAPNDSRVMRGALEHDVLCDLRPASFNGRAAADRFGKVIAADGIGHRKAGVMAWFVARFGPRW